MLGTHASVTFHLSIQIADTIDEDYTTGNKNTIIPWGLLSRDPSSWIDSECTPDGFEWKDPSKIRLAEAHRLLEHWRDRVAQGLAALIWVPSSPLFDDEGDAPNRGRRCRQPMDNLQDDSDGEVFVLPQSDEIEEDEYESNDGAQHQYRSSQDFPPLEDVMEDIMEASDASHSHEYFSCEFVVHVFDL